MNRTPIDWVKNPDGTRGYTWNPITGCLNHIDGMCKGGNFPCYAYKLANGRLKQRYLANQNVAYCYYRGKELIGSEELLGKCNYSDPFYPRFWEERCHGDLYTGNYPEHGKPKGIFVCDMSDLFGVGIPEEWTRKVIGEIELYPWHRFYLLTKQPQNLPQWHPFPENCFVGATVTNDTMMPAVIKAFDGFWANIHFISFEPLLGGLSKESLKQIRDYICQWVIIGALTGTQVDLLPIHHRTSLMMVKLTGNRWSLQPRLQWVEEIINACCKANIPYFLKDNLAPIIPGHVSGDKLHQEMPKVPN